MLAQPMPGRRGCRLWLLWSPNTSGGFAGQLTRIPRLKIGLKTRVHRQFSSRSESLIGVFSMSMNTTVGYGRERTEAQFELRLSVTGPSGLT